MEASYPELEDSMLMEKVARALAQGGIVGWFQGPMELGPRALGNRSILADLHNGEARIMPEPG